MESVNIKKFYFIFGSELKWIYGAPDESLPVHPCCRSRTPSNLASHISVQMISLLQKDNQTNTVTMLSITKVN